MHKQVERGICALERGVCSSPLQHNGGLFRRQECKPVTSYILFLSTVYQDWRKQMILPTLLCGQADVQVGRSDDLLQSTPKDMILERLMEV